MPVIGTKEKIRGGEKKREKRRKREEKERFQYIIDRS